MGVLRERNEFPVSVAWARRLQDDIETSGAKSLCGHQGGIVPSTSAMFGMPNMDGGLRAADRRQGPAFRWDFFIAVRRISGQSMARVTRKERGVSTSSRLFECTGFLVCLRNVVDAIDQIT